MNELKSAYSQISSYDKRWGLVGISNKFTSKIINSLYTKNAMSNETLVSRDRVNVDTNQLIGFWAELVTVLFLCIYCNYCNIGIVLVLHIRYRYLLTLLSPADLQTPHLPGKLFFRTYQKRQQGRIIQGFYLLGREGGVEGVIFV